jgi:hypothetical protein
LRIFTGVDLGTHTTHSFKNCVTIIGLASVISTQTLLSVLVFITLCESYLGIEPHFNLWQYFLCLKKKGGAGDSKVAGGAYLNLHEGMKAKYLNVPLSSSTKD